jgi:hypothetical protein
MYVFVYVHISEIIVNVRQRPYMELIMIIMKSYRGQQFSDYYYYHYRFPWCNGEPNFSVHIWQCCQNLNIISAFNVSSRPTIWLFIICLVKLAWSLVVTILSYTVLGENLFSNLVFSSSLNTHHPPQPEPGPPPKKVMWRKHPLIIMYEAFYSTQKDC